ncbi:hypothetical protein [Streptomyces sp. AC550_RSS872]|uniref:hypothetical protein n=1 Tax=Streptomyces sp. AC550_RSS872 TaxID=2823689 RepID=UPI001C25C645|nr:hypothetical protein [Streptomyces sp. AC550_RSS872]
MRNVTRSKKAPEGARRVGYLARPLVGVTSDGRALHALPFGTTGGGKFAGPLVGVTADGRMAHAAGAPSAGETATGKTPRPTS